MTQYFYLKMQIRQVLLLFKAVVVDSNPNHPIKDQVDRFIYYDFEDRKREEEHAENIARIVRELGLKLDGCFTFWEPSVELHAMICQKLGLKGLSLFLTVQH